MNSRQYYEKKQPEIILWAQIYYNEIKINKGLEHEKILDIIKGYSFFPINHDACLIVKEKTAEIVIRSGFVIINSMNVELNLLPVELCLKWYKR